MTTDHTTTLETLDATRPATTVGPVRADATEAAEAADGGPGRGRSPERGSARTWPLAALATLLVLALAAAAVLAVRLHSVAGERNDLRRAQASAVGSAQALDRAKQIATELTTYDYRDLAQQQRAVDADATARFRAKFAATNKTLAPLFGRLQARASGTVADAAVKSFTGTRAVVLLFVDQTARSRATKNPADQSSRLRMTLVQVRGTWLVDSVDLI